jgi:hypothetical protein
LLLGDCWRRSLMAEWKQWFRRPMYWITLLEQVNKGLSWSPAMSWLARFIKQLKKFRIFFLEKRAVKVVRYSYHKNPAQESRTKPGDHFYAQVAETD